jgi:hypothetical protein
VIPKFLWLFIPTFKTLTKAGSIPRFDFFVPFFLVHVSRDAFRTAGVLHGLFAKHQSPFVYESLRDS